VDTSLEDGPVRCIPVANLMKLLVAPESNIASCIASLMVWFLSCRSYLSAFLFSRRQVQHCVTFDIGFRPFDSTINWVWSEGKKLGLGGLITGGEMGREAAR
jgi:hypothetical protein